MKETKFTPDRDWRRHDSTAIDPTEELPSIEILYDCSFMRLLTLFFLIWFPVFASVFFWAAFGR